MEAEKRGALEREMQKNPYLQEAEREPQRRRGLDIHECSTEGELVEALTIKRTEREIIRAKESDRQCLAWKTLAFVRQFDDSTEWAVFKYKAEEKTWKCGARRGSFKTMAFDGMPVECVRKIIQDMEKATPTACLKHEWDLRTLDGFLKSGQKAENYLRIGDRITPALASFLMEDNGEGLMQAPAPTRKIVTQYPLRIGGEMQEMPVYPTAFRRRNDWYYAGECCKDTLYPNADKVMRLVPWIWNLDAYNISDPALRPAAERQENIRYGELTPRQRQYVDSPSATDRIRAAISGLAMEKLAYDNVDAVVEAVIRNGYAVPEMLERDGQVRAVLATEGFWLDVLAHDPESIVQTAVAEREPWRENLLDSTDALTRKRVAQGGWRLDALVNDPSEEVRYSARLSLKEAGFEGDVESWKSMWPERTAAAVRTKQAAAKKARMLAPVAVTAPRMEISYSHPQAASRGGR